MILFVCLLRKWPILVFCKYLGKFSHIYLTSIKSISSDINWKSCRKRLDIEGRQSTKKEEQKAVNQMFTAFLFLLLSVSLLVGERLRWTTIPLPYNIEKRSQILLESTYFVNIRTVNIENLIVIYLIRF